MILRGKHYWLIGASEGIGEALAIALAADGTHLTLSARNAEKLQAVLQSLAPGKHRVVPLDVTDAASVEAAWASIADNPIPLDGVIYNAGTYTQMDAQHIDFVGAERMVQTNFIGALRVVSLVVPYFLKRDEGHIALVGSVAGFRGLPSAIGYGASKAAVIHLAENLKADLYERDIKIQIINPGFVATRLTAPNTFKMPFLISAQKAAEIITRGLVEDKFEIHFPKQFTLMLKFLSLLPHRAYFAALRNMKM